MHTHTQSKPLTYTLLCYVLPHLHCLSPDSILSQACGFVHMVLKMSLRCRTPTIRSSRLMVMLKFRRKTPWKKLMNLSLSLKRRQGCFQSWQAWTCSSWLPIVWAFWIKWTLINNKWTRKYKDIGLLAMRRMGRRRRRLCLSRFHCLISISHIQVPLHHTCTFGQWRWCSRGPTYSWRGSASLLSFIRQI